MNKLFGVILVVLALSSMLFFSCDDGDVRSELPMVEKISPCSDALIGVVESYSSGVINTGEPLVVRFVQGLQMTRRYGEELPKKSRLVRFLSAISTRYRRRPKTDLHIFN